MAYCRFAADESLTAAAVTEDDRVIGLVDRVTAFSSFAKPFWREIYANRSVLQLADTMPLVAEASMPVDVLSRRIPLEKPHALKSGFIIVEDGRYAGIGVVLDVLRLVAEQTQQRSRELEFAQRAADQANRAKSTFLANISHELRTPLNAILGFSEMIASGMAGPVTARQAEYATDITNSGQMLLSLINDLLDLSKAEADQLQLREEPVDLEAVMLECARLLRPNATAGGLLLIHETGDCDAIVLADERIIRQIAINLIGNALKFTRPGGRVVTSVSYSDGAAVLKIEDTGIGIAPDDIPRILQPFTQIDNSWTRRVSGTGLGLPLVKRLAELHGGRLTIESRIDEGTTASVWLPPSRILQGGPDPDRHHRPTDVCGAGSTGSPCPDDVKTIW